MKPSDFPEANRTLERPGSMTDAECSSLRVYCASTFDAQISCWRPTWRERLAVLFGAPVWLWVTGGRHPPVAIEVSSPFKKVHRKRSFWRRLTARVRS